MCDFVIPKNQPRIADSYTSLLYPSESIKPQEDVPAA